MITQSLFVQIQVKAILHKTECSLFANADCLMVIISAAILRKVLQFP